MSFDKAAKQDFSEPSKLTAVGVDLSCQSLVLSAITGTTRARSTAWLGVVHVKSLFDFPGRSWLLNLCGSPLWRSGVDKLNATESMNVVSANSLRCANSLPNLYAVW